MNRTPTLLALLSLCLVAAPAAEAAPRKDGFKRIKKQLRYAAAQGNQDMVCDLIAKAAEDDSKRAVDLILGTAITMPKGKVFAATADALEGVKSEGAIEALASKVEKRGGHPGVKVLCIDALAKRSDARSGKALGAALTEKRPAVLRAALKAIRKRKPVEAIDGLFGLHERLLKYEKKRPDDFLQSEVESALIEMTGKYFENVEDWKKYWALQKETGRTVTGGGKDAPSTGERKKKPRPRFFGTEIRSSFIIFVIDVSGSMQGNRLVKAKAALTKCIDGLTARSRFTIVAYSSSAKQWNKNLQIASPNNKNKAKEFINALQATGNTRTLFALKEGFNIKGADTIILLSDGVPTGVNNKGERITEDTILDEIRGVNTTKKWRIDTFGFTSAGGELEKFMKSLAEKNDGKFTPIQ